MNRKKVVQNIFPKTEQIRFCKKVGYEKFWRLIEFQELRERKFQYSKTFRK